MRTMIMHEDWTTALAHCAQEAVTNSTQHIQQIAPAERDAEYATYGSRCVNELETLVSYLLSLIGACIDQTTFDVLMRQYNQLHTAVRLQRRKVFAPITDT